MILRVDSTLALPVYEQIREQVVRMVISGTLAEGTRMPTIRQLANDLQLAKGTIAKAYALLEEAEVVESRGHKGTFVAARPVATTVDIEELGQAAASFATTAVQLGADLELAVQQLREQWIAH